MRDKRATLKGRKVASRTVLAAPPKQPIDAAWPPLGVRDLPPDVPVQTSPDPAGFSTLKQALLCSLRKRERKP